MAWNSRGSTVGAAKKRGSIESNFSGGPGSDRSSLNSGDLPEVSQGLPPVVAPSPGSNRQLSKRSSDDSLGGGDESSEGDASRQLTSHSNLLAMSSRLGSKASTIGDRSKAKAFGVYCGPGWMRLRAADKISGGSALEKSENQPVKLKLDPPTAREFHSLAMDQLNEMYAFMESAMTKERARHSSDVHLLMRKVDKDLKDTFRAVREAFMSLTQQVQELLQEVDAGKKSIASVQAKFDAAKTSAAIRAQYVEELEAVLDGQVPNISEAMRKLSEELTCAKMHVDKINKESAEKDHQMMQERAATRATIRSLEERLNEKEVLGFAGATEIPLLPEMAATWTRRQHRPGSDGSGSFSGAPDSPDGPDAPGGVDVVMARSDATRAVTRNKCVRPLGARPASTPAAVPRPRRLTKAEEQQLTSEVASLKKRVTEADQRIARQQILFLDAAPSFQLLRDIFSELRENWRLKLPEAADGVCNKNIETLRQELHQTQKAPDILDQITQLFVDAFPHLGSFSEVLDALCEEAKRPTPQLSSVADALFEVVPVSEGGSPIRSCPSGDSAGRDGEVAKGDGDPVAAP